MPIKFLKENKAKNNINNYCTKLLKKINSGFGKKYENIKKNNKINKKNRSDEKDNKIKNKKSLDNNYISRNLLSTLRDSNRNKKRFNDYSFNLNNKNNFYRRNVIRPEHNVCITSDNKSSKNDTINTSRKSSCVLKKSRKIEQKPVQIGSSALKRINFQKIMKRNIHAKNSKEKTGINHSPLTISKSLLNESDNRERAKDMKIMKIKTKRDSYYDITFNKNKKLNKYLFKNKSISINSSNINNNSKTFLNNDNTALNIIIEDDNKIKNNSLFKKFIEYKTKINLKENKYTKINTFVKKSNNDLQNEFDKYKQNTDKIIIELKNKVDKLQKTIYDYENESKNKEKIRELVKNKQFIKAFDLSINLNKVNNIYYIIKKYIAYINENKNNKYELNHELLSKIIAIIGKDNKFYENLNIIIPFFINNISQKEKKIDTDLCKLIYNCFLNAYNNRKELCLSELEADNIKQLINYFK
jgi:hypothetical protein